MNVGALIRRAARLYGEPPAVTVEDRTLRFAEVGERCTRMANALQGLGVPTNGRIGIVVPNCLYSMELEFGCAVGGLARVALNVRLPTDELVRTFASMEIDALVYAGRYAEIAERVLDDRPDLPVLRLVIDERDETPGPGLGYEETLGLASAAAPSKGHDDDSLYCLFCTSGTTGAPKGVMLTHSAQLAVATCLMLEFGPIRPTDKVLLPQPLSHGGGFFMLPYFLSGGHCVVVEKFDPVGSFEIAERYSVDTLKLVPTMLIGMMEAGVAPSKRYAPRHIIYGASPIPRETLVKAMDAFGPILSQLYGQAEAPMCITVLPEEDHLADHDAAILSSAGRPWRNIDVRCVDEEGNEIPPGARGEVIVRGPHLMRGYWRDPNQTARVLRDGFVHTRDMATVDERGYIYLQGRMDEMINSGGFNIAPLLVENVLNEHPAVVESAVVGVPDQKWGERVKAFVVLRNGRQAAPEDLIAYCKPRLGLQGPKEVDVIATLPKNAYGKVLKSELKRL